MAKLKKASIQLMICPTCKGNGYIRIPYKLAREEITAVFKIMEYRLYYYIMNPAAALVWFSGLYLGHILGFDTWLIIKVGLVFILTAYHIFLGIHLKEFKTNSQKRSSKYFRIINEVPFLILFFILILVIMKPFY